MIKLPKIEYKCNSDLLYSFSVKLYEKLKNKNNITIQLLKDEGFYIYS